MEKEIELINRQWREVLDGKISRGYYNKSFLRWKLPHIIDAGNYISDQENTFVREFILPGITDRIDNPPLTNFIKGCKNDGLPYDFLIEVNKNHFWGDEFKLEPYSKKFQFLIPGQYRDHEVGQSSGQTGFKHLLNSLYFLRGGKRL